MRPQISIQAVSVRMGKIVSAESAFQEMEQRNLRISRWAKRLFNYKPLSFEPKETQNDLIVVSNTDLGQHRGGEYGVTRQLASRQLGLRDCSREHALLLCLYCLDQPFQESLVVSIDRIYGEAVFAIYQDDSGLILDAGFGDEKRIFPAGQKFVFLDPSNSSS